LVNPVLFSTVSLPFFGGSMMRTVETPIDEQSGLIEEKKSSRSFCSAATARTSSTGWAG
jgi:hypothetical protein